MKPKSALWAVTLTLTLAMLACQAPWNQTSTPTAANTSESPTVIETETPVETATETPTEASGPELPVFPDPVIFYFDFFTPNAGWAVSQDGNHLLVTEDGGLTWLDATPAGLDPNSAGMTSLNLSPFYLDSNTAWFTPFNPGGSTGELYRTLDGGVSWQIFPVPFNNARYFFVDLNAGFALVDLGVAAGSQYVALYQTTDGGAQWAEVFRHEPGVTKSLPGSGTKNGITFLDSNTGWIGGSIPMTDYFYLYTTADGGATWTQETDIVLPELLTDSFLEVWPPIFITDTVGYLPIRALTSHDDSYLLIYRSGDSGQTWTFMNSILEGRAVDFTSVDDGWITSGPYLTHTSDGAVSWSLISTTGIPPADQILKVDFVDGQHGWALTTPDELTWTPLMLYRTTDGVNWTQILP